ncbi:hypothetical protein [Rhizocola hellebori]|nr:hypothetical protein [Rhizocola hellebori]
MRVLRYFVVAVLAGTAALALPAPAHAAPSWTSPLIAPGVSHTFTWNNANPLNIAYEVGLNPQLATPEAPCEFEIMRVWYVQQYQGLERQLKVTIKNIGAIFCYTVVWLREMPTIAPANWYTPVLKPGEISTHTWNNAGLTSSHIPGLVPMGATSSAPCQLEVISRWDVLHYDEAGGVEREFKFKVANVGAISCMGAILLGSSSINLPWIANMMAPGEVGTFARNNANPLDKVYAIGIKPSHTQSGFSCEFGVQRRWYLQRINLDGTPEREFWFTVKNVGNLLCGPNILLT